MVSAEVLELIRKYDVDCRCLVFEITESAYIHNIDAVKIDKRFLGDGVSENGLTENGKIVLQEIFHLLKRTKKSIVCEGVETQEVADFLKQEGCDEIQGFLYYRPMCRVDFEKLMGC